MKKEKILASFMAAAIGFGAAFLPFSSQRTFGALAAPEQVTAAEKKLSLGDVNGDGLIDASDASIILVEYSIISTGGTAQLSDAENAAADVNSDSFIDSSDASVILVYYSYVSTGGKLSLKDFLMNQPQPPATTTEPVTTTKTTASAVTTAAKTTNTTAKPASTTTKAAVTTTVKPAASTTGASSATTVKPVVSTTGASSATTVKPVVSTTRPPVTTTVTSTQLTTTTSITTASAPITTAATTEATVPPDDPTRVAEIRVSRSECNINVGDCVLSADVTMLPKTAVNIDEEWTSSDLNVAKVDKYGWITGIGEGSCVITVRSVDNPDVYAEISVNVTNTSNVKDIRVSRSECTVKVGEIVLSANVTMLPSTAVNKNEIWTSSREDIVKVDEYGWIRGLKAGNSIITVKSEDNPAVFAVILVTVVDDSGSTAPVTTAPPDTTVVTTAVDPVNDKVTELYVSDEEISLTAGGKKDVYVTLLPETAANKNVTWKSHNEDIALVDANGCITAVKKGVCIVTVTSDDNPEIKKNIVVTVTASGEITEILLSKYEMTVSVGKADLSWVTMLPADAANKDEIWVSSNEEIATVDKYGWVYGKREGQCTVTVFSADNPSVKAEIAVTVVNDPVDNPSIDVLFSSIVSGMSDENYIAFMTPIPKNANGRYIIQYIITDENGDVTTITSSTITAPPVSSVITKLTAATNNFTASAYLINPDTNKSEFLGSYKFSLNPRDARTISENINSAFEKVS